jgi:hypothetical protein
MTVGAEPWDTEWAAERAAEALRYLGRNYPECLENLRALDEHETAVHEAALLEDREGYLAPFASFRPSVPPLGYAGRFPAGRS